MFSANKAFAGGITGAASDFITYLLTQLPVFNTLPPEQVQNLELIVSFVLVTAAVYFTPNVIPPSAVAKS